MTEDAAEAEQEEGGGGQRHQDEDRHRQQRPLQAQEMSPGKNTKMDSMRENFMQSNPVIMVRRESQSRNFQSQSQSCPK